MVKETIQIFARLKPSKTKKGVKIQHVFVKCHNLKLVHSILSSVIAFTCSLVQCNYPVGGGK